MNRLVFIMIVLLRAVAVAIAQEVTADNDPWAAFDKARRRCIFRDGLTLTISAPKTDYFAGEPVAVTFKYELNGPGGVTVWTRKFVRSVRVRTSVDRHRPRRQGCARPLAERRRATSAASGIRTSQKGFTPVLETFPLNEWVRFDTPGEYQIAAISNRIRDGGNGVASNRIKLNIRKPTDAEIDAAIAEYVKAIDDPNPEDNENPGRNLGYLRALYSERALPQYLKYLGKSDASAEALWHPRQTAFLERALTAKLQEPDFAITRDAKSIYEDLYRAVHPPEKGDTTVDWTGIPEAQRKAIDEDLHRWALAKSPKARANSLYGLDAGRNWPLEMAAALKDLDGYEAGGNSRMALRTTRRDSGAWTPQGYGDYCRIWSRCSKIQRRRSAPPRFAIRW